MKLQIDELNVLFPYDTIYPEQYLYIRKLKKSLDANGHCLLEMPSGTGKTISLLALTIAYMAKYPEKFAKIIYCSRTIQEMEQTLRELKKLLEFYKKSSNNHNNDVNNDNNNNNKDFDNFLALILASRKNLCINKEVMEADDGDNVDLNCYKKTASFLIKQQGFSNCDFFENFTKDHTVELQNGIFNLEDLRKFGLEKQICPYFLARKMVKKAHFIIYSYAYLLDPKVASIVSKNLPQNCIVIFDEAHNIDNACIEGLSLELSLNSVTKSIESINLLKDMLDNYKNEEMADFNKQYDDMVERLKNSDFGSELNFLFGKPVIPDDVKSTIIPGSIRKAENFLSSLKRFAGFVKKKMKDYHVVIESPMLFLREAYKEVFIDRRSLKQFYDQLTNLFNRLRISDIKQFSSLLKLSVLASLTSTYTNGFALIFEPFDTKSELYSPKLYVACLDASIAMRPVFDYFSSVIITSGTLSPIEFYPKLLNFKPSIIDSFSMSLARPSICPMIITSGNDQIPISSKYEAREEDAICRNYGNLVVEMSKIVPDGMICFFPSYFYMEHLITQWDKNGVLDRIQRNKLLFIETSQISETSIALENYKRACLNGRGAIFFSVARGKVSEGIDFSDQFGRCVILIGIPYMYTKSRVLIARMEFLRENFMMRESEFLSFDAIRHASQCLGRAIRNKEDYGILCLADQRYARNDKKSKFPRWITENLRDGFTNLTIDDAIEYSKLFLKHMAQKFTKEDQYGISMLKEDQIDHYLEINNYL